MVTLTGSLRNSDARRWMSVGHVALNISVCGGQSWVKAKIWGEGFGSSLTGANLASQHERPCTSMAMSILWPAHFQEANQTINTANC